MAIINLPINYVIEESIHDIISYVINIFKFALRDEKALLIFILIKSN